jgi:hypothetical protein
MWHGAIQIVNVPVFHPLGPGGKIQFQLKFNPFCPVGGGLAPQRPVAIVYSFLHSLVWNQVCLGSQDRRMPLTTAPSITPTMKPMGPVTNKPSSGPSFDVGMKII